MAVLYFSSPSIDNNLKVEASTEEPITLYDVAVENNIDIPFACENGLCGLCLIKVKQLDGDAHYDNVLTEKERDVLSYMGKLPEDNDAFFLDPFVPTYRLACQTIINDEDLLIEVVDEEE